jgi:hypothetical protein
VTQRPWHERTPHVIGASIAALIAIALLYFAATWLIGHYNQPTPPPVPVIVDSPASPATTAATTTTSSSYATTPPSTTDIDLPLTTETTSGTTPTTSTPTSITQSRHMHSPETTQHTTVYPQPQR